MFRWKHPQKQNMKGTNAMPREAGIWLGQCWQGCVIPCAIGCEQKVLHKGIVGWIRVELIKTMKPKARVISVKLHLHQGPDKPGMESFVPIKKLDEIMLGKNWPNSGSPRSWWVTKSEHQEWGSEMPLTGQVLVSYSPDTWNSRCTETPLLSGVVCGSGSWRTRPHNRCYVRHHGWKQPRLSRTTAVE